MVVICRSADDGCFGVEDTLSTLPTGRYGCAVFETA